MTMKNKSSKKQRITLVAAFLIAATVFASGCSGATATENNAPPDKDFLARVSIVGEIGDTSDEYTSSDDAYHHDWTMKTIDDLIKNDRNKG
ncbi:MAG: hypothetical protein LBT52_00005, partial [Clostridiales Family XIII bacterium]|nr:hypothetical protein [Clostridiales Family XIII bacterium]